jgi:lipopolysaccharide/colanic/teichoic acid biosynthesis glycosyltransferase
VMIKKYSIICFTFQLLLLTSAYVTCCYISLEINSFGELINKGLVIIIVAWLLTAWLTHKYKPQYYQKKWIYVIAPFLKAIVFQLFFVFLFSLVFLWLNYQNGLLYKSSLLYLTAELIIYSVLIILHGHRNNIILEPLSQSNKYLQEDLKTDLQISPIIDFSNISGKVSIFNENILTELHKAGSSSELINRLEINIIKSNDDFKKKTNLSTVCFLDIRINDLNDIDLAFKCIYTSLVPGGYLYVVYEDLDDFEERFISSSSRNVRFFKTGYYYLYYRAFPKIPYLNILYRVVSGGKNKVISKAEILGRFYYCGFEVEKMTRRDGLCFLLARKSKTPSENPFPSFYPVITLNRVGLYGNIIKIHKIRSMYPYSEFIQKRVFEEASMTATGKFENDYRITKLGKIYRRFWIDEIPQLLDWTRGKIKLVGIRAMSQHFFSLYPKEYQDLYCQVKPGIISPIFDEKTAGFEEIVKIEQEYLERFLKNPLKTDFIYFFRTIKHIFNGVRSY